MGRTATTVQQHIDTLNSSLEGLRGHLKALGLLQQPPTPLSTPPPPASRHQEWPPQAQQAHAVGSPEAVYAAMDALSVSVQYLLELLPSARWAHLQAVQGLGA